MAKREAYIPDQLDAEWNRKFPNANFSHCVRQMMQDMLSELESREQTSIFEKMYRAGARVHRSS